MSTLAPFHACFAIAIAAISLPALAQYQNSSSPGIAIHDGVLQNQQQAQRSPTRNLELTLGAQRLTNGFGNWRDTTLRGAYEIGSHVLQGELSAKREFNESGVFAGISDTYTFNADWYGSLSIGAGDGAFYLPKVRVDGALYKKWLDKRNLVTSVGLGYYDAPAGNTDRNLNFGATYYFDAPFIAEAGIRFNRSNPGSISTHQQFVALTYGHVGQYLITGRYGEGGEGYQTIAQNTQLVNFQSREASLAWRHWITVNSGFLISAEAYRNPNYQRRGINVGLFTQF
ncbi:MAG: YaiO family outer membrane beta-barrel protein [Burkholderiales bacterium]